MKTYTISIDFKSSIEAETTEEALVIASRRLMEREFTLNIIESEDV